MTDLRVRDGVLFSVWEGLAPRKLGRPASCLACGPGILGQVAGRTLRSDILTVLSTSVWWLEFKGLGLFCWKVLEQVQSGIFQLLLYRQCFQQSRTRHTEACRSHWLQSGPGDAAILD